MDKISIIEGFVSIIICTFNRSSFLFECVNSLIANSVDSSLYEIIIVNNNSTDNTQEIAEKFANKNNNIRVVIETQQGLCFARNRGYREANASFVAYIDDDAIAHDDWISRLLYHINENKYDAVGGVYLPWYKDGKPIWMLDSYVSNKNHVEKALNNIPGTYFFCGGNFLIKKIVLTEIQGFSTSIGMKGYKLGYGQEDELQVRMREKGYSIGLDDTLLIDHYVAPYKHSVRWFLKSRYSSGRDSWRANHQFPKIKDLIIYFILVFYQPFKGLPALINAINPKENYWIQNFVVEKFGSSAFYLGRLSSGFKLYFNDDRKDMASS
jgi:glycosyltransferase involved in cell wall biosynthesis